MGTLLGIRRCSGEQDWQGQCPLGMYLGIDTVSSDRSISFTSQIFFNWLLSCISWCTRTAGMFEKDTLLSLVVFKSQSQGDNCYIWSTAPGLTKARGLRMPDSPFLSPKLDTSLWVWGPLFLIETMFVSLKTAMGLWVWDLGREFGLNELHRKYSRSINQNL